MFYKKAMPFKKVCIILIMILACITPFIASYFYFPEEIHLILGKENDISFNIPIRATLTPEKAGVININNQSVDDNIDLSLDEPIKMTAQEEGNIKLKLSLFGLIPLKQMTVSVIPNMEVIPCGNSIGVKINTEGVLVLGTGSVNSEDGKSYEPSKNILKSGDLILTAGEEEIATKEQLIKYIENKEDTPVSLSVKRDKEIITLSIRPIKSADDNKYKIGVWVRDSTGGIGTMTYYDPVSNTFGALGHGIVDVDTKKLMEIKDGAVMESSITSVNKGKKGSPGELLGNVLDKNVIGDIKLNTPLGIYGELNKNLSTKLPAEKMPIALKQDIKEGRAYIRSNILGKEIQQFEIEITNVNKYSNDDCKGMIVKITDANLLEKTGGIVQGMSGSPIIQNGKIIGAITHVFVQDPTKGYGIFIENMLKQQLKSNDTA